MADGITHAIIAVAAQQVAWEHNPDILSQVTVTPNRELFGGNGVVKNDGPASESLLKWLFGEGAPARVARAMTGKVRGGAEGG